MVGSDGDTAEVRGERDVAVRKAVIGVAVVVLAVVVPWAAAWMAARPGPRPWGPVLFVLGCVAVAAALSGARRLTRRRMVVGLIVGLVAVSSIEALRGYQSGSLLYRRLEPELEQLASVAHAAASDDQYCQNLPNGPVEVPGHGSVDRMCRELYGTAFSGPGVESELVLVDYDPSLFLNDDATSRWILYEQCVALISSQWVERTAPEGTVCPPGFFSEWDGVDHLSA